VNVHAGDAPELVRRSFRAPVLRDLLALRHVISASRSRWRTHMKWALLGSLRDLAAVKVGWPYQRPGSPRRPRSRDCYGRYLARIAMMVADLRAEPDAPDTCVALGDARDAASWDDLVGHGRATACCTSPPYLNNFDYADATRLELFFWGDVRTWSEMCGHVRRDMLVSTTQQTRVAAAEAARAELARWDDIGRIVLSLCNRLREQRHRRPRGKEYDAVLPQYVRDIDLALRGLIPRLRPGAAVAWVIGDSAPYGVYIDTPALTRRVAERAGYEFQADIMLRHRGLRWRASGTRHQHPLAERMLLLRTPSSR
jgi:hypothetical protein